MNDPTVRSHRTDGVGQSSPRSLERLLPGWVWAIVAGVATLVAILLQNAPAVEVFLAACAVAAAGLTIARSLGPRAPRVAVQRRVDFGLPVSVRDAFRSGSLGREDLVILLDRLERVGLRPNLPIRSSEEVQAIVGASEPEFLRYLEGRLTELEGAL